jgi:hypothetical protein
MSQKKRENSTTDATQEKGSFKTRPKAFIVCVGPHSFPFSFLSPLSIHPNPSHHNIHHPIPITTRPPPRIPLPSLLEPLRSSGTRHTIRLEPHATTKRRPYQGPRNPPPPPPARQGGKWTNYDHPSTGTTLRVRCCSEGVDVAPLEVAPPCGFSFQVRCMQGSMLGIKSQAGMWSQAGRKANQSCRSDRQAGTSIPPASLPSPKGLMSPC